MAYFFNTPEDQREMLEAIGIEHVDELFSVIPEELRLKRPLDIEPKMSELQLTQHLAALAAQNGHAGNMTCFLGGGSYDHFIPAVVDTLAARGEFYTSYTPYQPEVSQGNLQATFEYQTLICQLTGLDVSNASLYDGGSAAAEAILMAMSVAKRMQKVVVLDSVHPEYRAVIQTYLENFGTELVTVPTVDGIVDLEQLTNVMDESVACVLVQYPNFFGCIEDLEGISQIAHQFGAVSVCSFDPISMGLLKRPGDLGVDIAIAEGQGLGTNMQYGGPYLGIMACRERFVRRLPGRIAGQTVDRNGKRCWVLTLQTREQHIRREKATSNICTNQGLFALRAAIYLATMGPQGLKEVANHCLQKAHYAQQRLCESERFERTFAAPYFKEFVVTDRDGQVQELLNQGKAQGILAGLPLERWYPQYAHCLLIAVTEKRTQAEIHHLTDCLTGTSVSTEAIHA